MHTRFCCSLEERTSFGVFLCYPINKCSSFNVIFALQVGGEPVERRKRGPAKKPETMPEVQPQEQAPVKRKRGRPPKNKNAPQPSDASPSTTRKRPRKERISSSSGDHPETTEPTTEPQATEVATQVTETVVKRKRGRPLKNINTQTQTTESPLLAARLPNESVVDPTSATSGEERGSESIPKRGRTVKSSKVGVKTPEATQPAPVKRKRGRPRKYPIPVVAASGPFLPSVSGVTLPSDDNEDTTIVGEVHLLPNGKESGSEPAAARPAKNKRGRPPKKPQDEEEEPPVKRKRGRPRKNPLPAEGEETASPKRPQKQEEQRQQQVRKKPGRPRKQLLKNSPEVIQQKTKSPVAEKETDPLPKRKRGRPRKVPLVVTTVQEPASVSSADESSVSVNVVDNSEGDSTAVEKLTLQISFSDSDSEHSEKMEVQTSAIMALANRVASTPSPPRQLDSPLLDPSFEESYDEDSDPDTK